MVNGKAPTARQYTDPYTRLKLHDAATVNQHHMLRVRLAPLVKDPPEEELVITLPKGVKIEPTVCTLITQYSGAPSNSRRILFLLPLIMLCSIAISQVQDGIPLTLPEEQ